MTARRIVWFGASGVALASWFAAASTSGVRTPVPAAPRPPSAIDRSMSTLQSEVGRLQERLGPTVAPTRSRDLFRFSPRVPTRSAAPAAQAAPASEQQPATRGPAFILIGIAEDTAADGTPVRTAIVTGTSDLFLVKAGDVIQERYRVDQVSSDAVQLVDTASSASIVLALH